MIPKFVEVYLEAHVIIIPANCKKNYGLRFQVQDKCEWKSLALVITFVQSFLAQSQEHKIPSSNNFITPFSKPLME